MPPPSSPLFLLVFFFACGTAYAVARVLFFYAMRRAQIRREENAARIRAYLTGCFGDPVSVPIATATVGGRSVYCLSCQFWSGGSVRVYISRLPDSIGNPGEEHLSLCTDPDGSWLGPSVVCRWSGRLGTVNLAHVQSHLSELYLKLEQRNHGDAQ